MNAALIRDLLLAEVLEATMEAEFRFDEYLTLKRLGTPRSQLREALSSLHEAGLLKRARRTGTSLTHPQFHYAVAEAQTVPPTRPVPVRFETLGIEDVPAPSSVSMELTGAEGASLRRISRISVIDGRASEHWTIWTLLEFDERTMRDGFPRDKSWYDVVAGITGSTTFSMTRRTINYRATANDREMLDVDLGDPLRFTTRALSLVDGTPIDRAWGRTNSQLIISSESFTIHV